MTDLDLRPPSSPRSRKKAVWSAVAVLVVIGVAVALALFQPWKIFTRNTVDEALPGGGPAAATLQAEPSGARATLAGATPAAVTPPPASTAPAPVLASPPPAVVQSPAAPGTAEAPEPIEPTDPIVLAAGAFVDGEHTTAGTATVLQLPDGSRFVRLENFSTSDGPDVHVWVTDQRAGGDDWGKYDDGRHLELGSLKGTDGNQNYAIPADAELSGLTSVVIWCDRFNVAFGSAEIAL